MPDLLFHCLICGTGYSTKEKAKKCRELDRLVFDYIDREFSGI
jgi:hypothetical protein